jgi:hypothetical protein
VFNKESFFQCGVYLLFSLLYCKSVVCLVRDVQIWSLVCWLISPGCVL